MRRLLDHDKLTCISTFHHYDASKKETTIEYQQDVEHHLDANTVLRNDDDYTKKGMKDDFWHYAHIPDIVQLQWIIKYGLENDPMKKGNEKLLFSLLNSREYCRLKTTNK